MEVYAKYILSTDSNTVSREETVETNKYVLMEMALLALSSRTNGWALSPEPLPLQAASMHTMHFTKHV